MPYRKPGEVSLARAVSKLGAASRAEAARRIAAGRVTVDGVVVTDPEMPVVPERAAILVDGERARRATFRFILFHKPRGVVTTRSDPEGRTTVFDLLGEAGAGLVAVGRLDFATSGLLLLTNDTQLANALADPSNAIPRVYLVTVRGRWTAEKSLLVKEGVDATDGVLRATEVVARKVSGRESHLVVTLSEGKNRELRRLFAAAAHEVTRLKRVSFGGLELGTLGPGRFREVEPNELDAAFPPIAGFTGKGSRR